MFVGGKAANEHQDIMWNLRSTMQTISTDVLVIGGGATGLGCVRDLAMRGIRAILVEKGDLTNGTTGRYHGLLHSGGRYVTKDPQSATECADENAILRRIMPHCLEDTSGFFVITPWDDPLYGDVFEANCHKTGVPVQEISVAEMLRREPALNPQISRVFEVPDGSADSFLAAHTNALSAREHGAQILTYHSVVGLTRAGDAVRRRDPGGPAHRRAEARRLRLRAERRRGLGRQDRRHGRREGDGRAGQGHHGGHEPPHGEHGDQPL